MTPNDFDYIPPKLVIPPATAVVNAGDDAFFDCIPNASPWSLLRIDWTRNEVPLSAGAKYEMKDAGRRLVVKDVVAADAGTFACQARMLDEVRQPGRDRGEAELIVQSRPRIVASSLPNIFSEVFWGKTLVLRCQGEGSPPPTITWYKDAEALPTAAWSHVVVSANHSLVINAAGKADEGVYQCVVTNPAGSASFLTVLQVRLLPFLITTLVRAVFLGMN